MGDKTGISWTDATWNPTRGCQVISPGCANCYAMRQAGRMSGKGGAYEGLVKLTGSGFRWTGAGRLVPKMLDQPLRWTKPRRIFVDSMSDLFYEGFSNVEIAAVFGIMAAAPQHTFQVLTKRAKRMREWFEWMQPNGLDVCLDHANEALTSAGHALWSPARMRLRAGNSWPLPNVWLGVSAEDQKHADERIPELLATPAALRWVSLEPQFEAVDLSRLLHYHPSHEHHQERGGVDLRGGTPWGDGDPCGWDDLAHRKEGLESVVEGRSNELLQEGAGGQARPEDRIPVGAGNGQRGADDRNGPSARVAPLQRPIAGRDDDQPQERREVRQPTAEPRARDSFREHEARDPRAANGTSCEPARREEHSGQADFCAGDGDPRPKSQRREVASAGKGVRGCCADHLAHSAWRSKNLWIVQGGESGPGARTFDLAWAESMRDACKAAGVPWFMKQLGAVWAREHDAVSRAGADPSEWPEALRVQEFPR